MTNFEYLCSDPEHMVEAMMSVMQRTHGVIIEIETIWLKHDEYTHEDAVRAWLKKKHKGKGK